MNGLHLNANVSIWAAFVAGILSFLSPCILPLIPSYIFFLSGTTASSIENEKKSKIITNALLFILGFSLVFIMLGAGASTLGRFLRENIEIIKKIAGVMVIVFGVHVSGLIQLKALLAEKRFHFKTRPTGYLGSFLIGVAFAFGWTPCLGPILGSILLIAGTRDTIWWGITLLSFYSLGVGIPFLLVALSLDMFSKFFTRIKKYMPAISIISGAFLVIAGILMILNIL